MRVFFTEWAYVLSALGILALSGGFLLRPFLAPKRIYFWLASPIAGMCALSVCFTLGYALNLSFRSNLLLSVGGCAGMTSVFLLLDIFNKRLPAWQTLLTPIVATLAVTGGCTAALCESAERADDPAILYMGAYYCGTDTLGYTHLADWYRTHKASEPAVADPAKPYESWANFGIMYDGRSGTFMLLAAAAVLKGVSCTFAYDFACATALSAGMLGFAGTFARSRATFFYLLAGILFCGWFDLSRSGFFGKLLAYPAVIFIGSLIYQDERDHPCRTHALAMLTIGASLEHSGASVAFLSAAVGAGIMLQIPATVVRNMIAKWRGLLPEPVSPHAYAKLFDLLLVCGLGILICVFLMKSLPVMAGFNAVTWQYVMLNTMDLWHIWTPISETAATGLFAAIVLLQLALGILALVKRKDAAAGLLFCGPALLFIGWLTEQRYALYQSTGIFYPAALVGALWLFEEVRFSASLSVLKAVATMAAILIVFRIPRFIGSCSFWLGSNVPCVARFSRADIDTIRNAVGDKTVELQFKDVYRGLFAMVELGGGGTSFQLNADSWQTLLSYRHWQQPPQTKPNDFLLIQADAPIPAGEIVFRNCQFILVKRQAH